MYGTIAKLHLNTNITRSLGEDTKRGGKGRGWQTYWRNTA